jgi:lipopolysaccharide/colanic/teichoic acid biosynthesis glycosyltransferase
MNRVLDLGLGLVAITLLAPLLGLVALINWAVTRQVFFRQVRIGRGLRPFTILKFQTMVDGPGSASTVTVAGDYRLTPLGRVLRGLKLDELPQLVNVVRGEMSLVGPRALTPNEVDRIPGEVAARVYTVRPGMTGLASLVFSNEERILADAPRPEDYYFGVILPQKMALETVYVQRKSLWLDALILIVTPLAILAPGVARALLRLIGADSPESRSGFTGATPDSTGRRL